MKRSLIIFFILALFFTKCHTPSIELEASLDPYIVLVNIEQGDRAFIGKVLLKLDSLNPLAVGINVTFQGRKKQDSGLVAALERLKNDILIYNIRNEGQINGSDSVFTNHTDQGNSYYEQRLNLITTIIPQRKINDRVHESFAFKIIKHWKPEFVSKLNVDEKIDIHYTRNLEKFYVVNGSMLLDMNVADLALTNKVFLVGYTGPEDEDKHFTPLRFVNKKYKANEPDTYGLVIIANEVRTILEYKNWK